MKVLAAKYNYLVKTYMKSYRKYPLGLFLKLVYLPIQLFMYLFLWIAVSQNSKIDLNYMVCYYLLVSLLGYAYPFVHIAKDIQEDIIEGGISNYLVRPLSYMSPMLSKYIAWMCLYAIVYIPALGFIFFFRGIEIGNILMFLVLAILGMGIEFLIWYNVGLLSFHLGKIGGTVTAIMALRTLISGALIPLSFFPDFLQNLSWFFPFQYYIYIPVNSLLNGVGSVSFLTITGIEVLWIVGLSLLGMFQWNLGLKKHQVSIS
ncbi:MAG: ABC-2 family transporter protein [Lachnospiraceae bacterium]